MTTRYNEPASNLSPNDVGPRVQLPVAKSAEIKTKPGVPGAEGLKEAVRGRGSQREVVDNKRVSTVGRIGAQS